MAFTKTRRTKAQRWFELACGHKQYGSGGESWEAVTCLTCGQTMKVVSMQGPAALEDMFRL